MKTAQYWYKEFKRITGCRMDYGNAAREAIQIIINETRRDALEDAAKIAETYLFKIGEPSHLCSGGSKIAKAIRAEGEK